MDNRFRVFVGDNLNYYERAWKKEYSWNWAAFFLSIVWLGYRRMFNQLFIILSIQCLLVIMFFKADPENDAFISVIGLATSIFLGFCGNKLYKRKTEKVIMRVGFLKLSESDELKELEQRGGVSGMGLFGAICSFVLWIFVTGTIIAFLYNQ